MYPSLEKLRQLKTDSTYRRFPVRRELYTDRYTPVEVMRILRHFCLNNFMVKIDKKITKC